MYIYYLLVYKIINVFKFGMNNYLSKMFIKVLYKEKNECLL